MLPKSFSQCRMVVETILMWLRVEYSILPSARRVVWHFCLCTLFYRKGYFLSVHLTLHFFGLLVNGIFLLKGIKSIIPIKPSIYNDGYGYSLLVLKKEDYSSMFYHWFIGPNFYLSGPTEDCFPTLKQIKKFLGILPVGFKKQPPLPARILIAPPMNPEDWNTLPRDFSSIPRYLRRRSADEALEELFSSGTGKCGIDLQNLLDYRGG